MVGTENYEDWDKTESAITEQIKQPLTYWQRMVQSSSLKEYRTRRNAALFPGSSDTQVISGTVITIKLFTGFLPNSAANITCRIRTFIIIHFFLLPFNNVSHTTGNSSLFFLTAGLSCPGSAIQRVHHRRSVTCGFYNILLVFNHFLTIP